MFVTRPVLFAVIALSASACSSILVVPDAPSSAVRVINASKVPIDVVVDGAILLQGLTAANVSTSLAVTAGAHVVQIRSANSTGADLNVQTISGQTLTTVALSATASTLSASILADTGSIVPGGKSKLRVAHLAGGAGAIEIWRTQPDYQTPIHIMTPFAYQATSPYLQSDPGAWEVFVTAPGSTVKLATTGSITVPSGERRTVVLLDSAGVMRFRVIVE